MRTYEHEYDGLLKNKTSPGPARYETEQSFKHITKSIKTSFPKATRNNKIRLQTTVGPTDYETTLQTWKKATVEDPPRCVIPKAYRRFDIIKCKLAQY